MSPNTLPPPDEAVREALLDLKRARDRERALRTEAEGLLEGVRVLSRHTTVDRLFPELLRVLRRVLLYEEAFILRGRPDQILVPAAATSEAFLNTQWRPQEPFQRVLDGETVAAFDVAEMPEWAAQPERVRARVVSALHVAIQPGEQAILLVCTHGRRAFFGQRQVELMQRFSPLAAHALLNIRAREAAEEALRVKTQFLANVSHEVRTPLNAIIGMIELVLDTRLTEEQREYLAVVRSSADELLTMVNDILDFSKKEAGKLNLDCLDFNLRERIDDVMDSLALKAHEKGLELAARIRPGVPEAVRGDPKRLRQVLVNLLSNAIKFTDQGEVVLEVKTLEDGGRSRTDPSHRSGFLLEFSVRDTGMGIPEPKQPLIFQAFVQVDGSTTRRHGGTGLGLAICSQLVELMGGRIWVESAPEKGSNFSFTAHLDPPQSPPPRRPPETLEALCGGPVLVVDDNATSRGILLDTLRAWGLKPVAASGGREGLARFREAGAAGRPFRLVLVDAGMPGLDGFELVERMQRLPEHAGAAILMLSSANREADATRCRSAGVSAYLTKPVRRGQLREAIAKVLGPADRGPGRGEDASPPGAEPRGPVAGTRAGGGRVLLAEDNPINRRVATRLLEKRGYEVTPARDGREALGLVAGQTFDLVLMDVQMPEMDGLEATAAIREMEQNTGRHVPIIAVTAHARPEDRARCLEAGMDDFLTKPIRADTLHRVLQRHLRPAVPSSLPGR